MLSCLLFICFLFCDFKSDTKPPSHQRKLFYIWNRSIYQSKYLRQSYINYFRNASLSCWNLSTISHLQQSSRCYRHHLSILWKIQGRFQRRETSPQTLQSLLEAMIKEWGVGLCVYAAHAYYSKYVSAIATVMAEKIKWCLGEFPSSIFFSSILTDIESFCVPKIAMWVSLD